MPDGTCPTILDIGCGFGGLTVALAKLFPDEAVLGMEIRAKVTEYVRLRIAALRKEGCCQNASVMRTNSMKFLPHYFPGGSVRKMFFCFPDPHFKRKNRPRRIVSGRLLSEYAHALRPVAGRLYCVTDVPELHRWHVEQCDAHPLFRRISEAELADDPCVGAMKTETEEGQKVTRNGGEKYYAVYQRIPDRDAEPVHAGNFFATTTSK
jgi:tRNA (guanine-N7-)-methyltransferase